MPHCHRYNNSICILYTIAFLCLILLLLVFNTNTIYQLLHLYNNIRYLLISIHYFYCDSTKTTVDGCICAVLIKIPNVNNKERYNIQCNEIYYLTKLNKATTPGTHFCHIYMGALIRRK